MSEPVYLDTLAVIPLRAGSKGLKNKNLRPLAGRPLYQHSLEQAVRVVGRCCISTDIPDLVVNNRSWACDVVKRPPELATDQTPMGPVLMHLFDHLERKAALPKIAVLMQATSPLRRDEDIHNAVKLYKKGQFDLVMSVIRSDSNILKYGFTKDGCFTPISRPDYCFSNRQSLPNVVRPNGAVYVFSPEKFMKTGSLSTDSIGSVEMPERFSIDIDTLEDLNTAEDLLSSASLSKAG